VVSGLAAGGREVAAWQALSAFASLGWEITDAIPGGDVTIAVLGLLAGLGWTIWLWPLLGTLRRRVLLAAGGYVVWLALAGGLIAALDVPRGLWAARVDQASRGEAAPLLERFGDGLVQVAAASGAGVATRPLEERAVSAGARLVLAGVVLVGGLGGAVAGGAKWLAVIAVLSFVWRSAGRDRGGAVAWQDSCAVGRGAVALVGALFAWTLIVTVGLLMIETRVASVYETPPPLDAALLEAASAVGGANLTTGMTERITGSNLSSGMHQSTDSYQYGMWWLMLAMFIGRVLPVVVLGWLARRGLRPTRPVLPLA
jgi:Trk-type K+ transport system membrane component